MKKKLLALVLCLVMVTVAVVALVACSDGDYDYEITVWVGEGTKGFTEQQIKKFNETNQWGIKFKATVEVLSESVAAGNAISKPQNAADIFCFAQDQLARLVQSDVLAPVSSGSQDEIIANNIRESVDATRIGGIIRAFPMTYDNGYFMYYDKDIVKTDITDLDSILADCKAANQNFSMRLAKDGGGWYAASFFYGAGCKSEWTTDDSGKFTAYDDNFWDYQNGNGLIALQGIQKVLDSGVHQDSAEIGDMSAGTPSAVVISGIWSYNASQKVKDNSGKTRNIGIAPLPSFKDAQGNSHQLKTYLGSKLMGGKRQSDGTKVAYLQKLALYLTSEDVQLARFKEVGWGPCNTNLQDNAEVIASPALKVFADSIELGAIMSQGQYPTNWWAKVQLMVGNAKKDPETGVKTVDDLKTALDEYKGTLNSLKGSSAS